MRIGQLSQATGASTRALRYYEERGLISSERLPNGYRDYAPKTVETVDFIRDLLDAGLSSDVLRSIIPCVTDGHGDTSCSDLFTKAQEIRDGLLDQERRLRVRREKLEQYLNGDSSPGRNSGPNTQPSATT